MSPEESILTDGAGQRSASAHDAHEPTHDAGTTNRSAGPATASDSGLCIDRGGEPATGVGVDPHVSEDEATKAGEASPRSSEEGYIYPQLQTSLDSETLRQLRAEWRSSRKRRKRGLPETTGTTKGRGRLHHEAAFK